MHAALEMKIVKRHNGRHLGFRPPLLILIRFIENHNNHDMG